jgi:hypothetical protein
VRRPAIALRMGLEHEDEVEHVRGEQDEGEADVEQRLLPQGLLGREDPIECARHGQADRGDQHHRAVHARGGLPVGLRVETHPADEEGDAEREQQVREDRADDRRAHHVKEPRAERHQGDDQLGRIAEGGVQESADGVAGVGRELLRRPDDEARDREDGDRRDEEHPGRRRAVLERERDRDQREQPVDRGLHGREAPSGAARMGYAAARRRARAVQMRPSSQ